MKVVFAGTPEFASVAYEHIVDAGFEVPLVLTQPDRRAGRGMKLMPTAVKQAALVHGAQVMQPLSLSLTGQAADEAQAVREALEALAPDVMVVAAYGLLLPQWVLDLPRYGCLNIHASLLPRWRGAAPIQRAIEAGDEQTGVGIMQMALGLDTGPVLLQKSTTIDQKNASELHDELALLGAQAMVEVLTVLRDKGSQAFDPQPQDEALACYAHKLSKAEALLDWAEEAAVLERKIRAFTPFPGAKLSLPGLAEPVKIWRASVRNEVSSNDATDKSSTSAEPPTSGVTSSAAEASTAAPGTVLVRGPETIEVACGRGVLVIHELQKPGGRRQSAAQFITGWRD